MRTESVHTKISACIVLAAIVVLAVYFIAVAPYPPITDYRGLLGFSPPLFGVFGLLFAILGCSKTSAWLNALLITVNIIFLCWWPIVFIGGTLLFGP